MGKKKNKETPGEVLVCRNPKAVKSYDFEERYEAGLVLSGSEVKSMRERRADLEGAYASVHGDEVFLHKMHVAPYLHAGAFGHEPRRTRKLLLHRHEIERIRGRLVQKGYALVPLQVYFKKGFAKVQVGLGKGRTKGDQRHELRKQLDLKEARAAVRKIHERDQ
ncbi:MAG: SsrA-binding protein SmpB [Myxococcota bacterium]